MLIIRAFGSHEFDADCLVGMAYILNRLNHLQPAGNTCYVYAQTLS